ncbi:MAG: transcriptional regulator [Clostridia bacterium]|nr:transcriptional regulator [Clostridia bacterium]
MLQIHGQYQANRILFLPGEEELCVEELATRMDVLIPNVSQHLANMHEKGVVASRRVGNKIYYHLSNQKTLQACFLMREAMIERYDRIMTTKLICWRK